MSDRNKFVKRSTGRKRTGSGDRQSGSSEPDFLIVGKIARPHGVRGEVGMKLMTNHPEHLLNVKVLYLGPDMKPHKVTRMRRHHEGMIITFENITDRDMAELLREHLVHVHRKDAVPLEAGEYFLFQIEGIRVVTDDGEELGRLTGYIETGANDVYIVTSAEGQEILLPVIPDVILKVDVPARIMTVRLLEGLR